MAKYRKTSRDKIIERANARKNQNTGSKCLTFKNLPKDMKVEFWKPTKSIHNLDIIGYVLTDDRNPDCDDNLKPGYLWYGRNYWVHRGVGADDDMVVCPAKTFGERCPICEYAKQRRASGEASKEELDALKPKQRQLFNVIDRDSGDNSVKLFDNSYHLFGKQLDKEILDAEDEEVAEFFEPTNGFTLRARFEKKSFNGREFFECDRIDFKDRQKQYKESIIDETYPLDDMLNHMTYDQLNELFVMGAELNEPDDNNETRIRKAAHDKEQEDREQAVRDRRARRSRQNDDDDDDADDTIRGSEDADDDDTPPARSSRGRRAASRNDDDDADNEPAKTGKRGRRADKEEDDEDEKPRGRGRKPNRDEEEDDDVPFEEEKPRGRGRPRKPDPEPDDDEPEEKPRGGRRRNNDDDGDTNKCPHGMKFGKDCDSADECDDCKKWAACNAANRKSK